MLVLLLLALLWRGSLQDKEYKLQVLTSVRVQEGLCVTVPCNFSYPWEDSFPSGKLYIFWFEDGANIYRDPPVATNKQEQTVKTETRRRFRFLGDPSTNDCSLSITDARKSDTGIYFLRVERGLKVRYNYKDKLHLRVTDFREKPNIYIPELLESGRPTNLTCSLPGYCDGGRPLTFSWTGGALSRQDPSTLQSSVLTLIPRPQDHGTYLTCLVKHQRPWLVTKTTIQLNVSYAPKNLTVFFQNGTDLEVMGNTSSLSILEGQSLRLMCVAESQPPAELIWFQGSRALNASSFLNKVDLELHQVRIENEGEFTCRAKNRLGSQNVSLSLSVLYPLQLLGPSCSWDAKILHCNCSVQAWPASSLNWWIGDRLIKGNSSNDSLMVTTSFTRPWINSSLSLHTELSSVLRLCCEAQNDHEHKRITVLLLPVKSASRAEVVLGALGGAGTMALLSLCLCLGVFFIVKVRRKQAAEKSGITDDEDPVMDTVTWSHRQKSWPENPPEQESPSGVTPPLPEELELHYASLTFHGTMPQEPKDQTATSTTEYSEIKTSK
ncbi:PREDICTED: sialic acid-binding Ig-like lectin 5 [Chrysochloris asiatica]|uniref:Sialic acid-binding Ig-like lectin 5 n=1 Tax=Chrysochloris asiatica TaxID=185453 RepID=A0A9B0TQF5_CHRAS|nr:PREDICTED: sialic acid-binding Ig-like lectin 5 [Chrysochloris asiatica]